MLIEYNKNNLITNRELTEQFVDEDYKIDELSEREEYLLESLQARFWQDDKSTIYKFSQLQEVIKTIKYPCDGKGYLASGVLRKFWRAGKIRRFVEGRWSGPPGTGRGNWYGVWYTLYE